MDETPFKLFELGCLCDQLSLHLWSHLLIELEFLNDQVVIIQESLVDVIFDVVVKIRLDMEWLVGLLDFLDPHIQRVKFFINQILKIIGSVEDAIDGAHQKGEEYKTNKLKNNGEYVLFNSFTRIVSVAHCGDNLKDPIESKDILSVWFLFIEAVLKNPGVHTTRFCFLLGFSVCYNFRIRFIFAVSHFTESQPDDSHEMICVDNQKNKTSKST